MGMLEGDTDFPAGAAALMYEPPLDDFDGCRGSSDDDWADDSAGSEGVPQLSVSLPAQQRPSCPPAPFLQAPQHPGGSARFRAASSGPADIAAGFRGGSSCGSSARASSAAPRMGPREPTAATPNGFGVHGMPSPPPIVPQRVHGCGGAPGRPLQGERQRAHELDAASPSTMVASQRGACGGSSPGLPGIPPAPPPAPLRQQVAMSPASPAGPWPGAAQAVQPRSLSYSARAAQQMCSSEAGAASIAAILECVAHAQDLPAQQRPNSEKWAGRWQNCDAERYVPHRLPR